MYKYQHSTTCRHAFVLMPVIIACLFSCAAKMTPVELKDSIQKELEKQQGHFAVAFKNLSTGEELFINEHESFHAASTMKTPVMIEVYKQVAAGKFSLSDSILLKNEFKSIVDSSTYSLNPDDDSEKELYKKAGTYRTISSLVYDMIIVSSNFATNTVIEKVGAKNVNATMREMGCKDIQVLRGVEDNKAYQKGLNNTTTAYDLMLIFQNIAEGKAVSPTACDAMIKTLKDQQFNTIIPALLPKDVKVAHKTGNITGVHHDSGIVMLPDGRKYVLVLLSKNLKDENAAVASMARVSEMIYKYVNHSK